MFWIANPTPDRQPGELESIAYTHWDGQQWSEPTDILVAPSGRGISDYSVFVDDADGVYLLLLDQASSLPYYYTASLAEAGRPQAWVDHGKLLYDPVMSAGLHKAAGTLYLTYQLAAEPFRFYIMKSYDDGSSWLDPVQVSALEGWGDIPQSMSLAFSPDGVIHLGWANHQLPERYPPERILYARSADDGETWSEPLEMQEGKYGIPLLLVTSQNVLYLTYNGAAGVNGRYFRWSADGGLTWSERTTIAPGVGGLTGGTWALDSAGTLHYASASHIGGINGIGYSQWAGGAWTPLIDIAKTPAGTEPQNRQGYEPRLAISEGNRIHVVYLGANHGAVFYVTAHSAAPEVAPVELPATSVFAPTDEPTVGPTATLEPTSTPQPQAISLDAPEALNQRSSTATPMLKGLLPAMLIIGVVIVTSLVRRRG